MKQLLNTLFPKDLNNHYTGYKIPLYVFYLLTIITLWRSQHHLLSADGGAQSIATIPLDTFTQAGSAAVIGVFGLWGLSQLVIGLLYVVVAFRYRAMVPLMYLFMLLEYLVRAFYIPIAKPIPTVGTAPGGAANLPLIIIALIMLIFSLMTPKKKTT
jgi:hypothetical protein